MTSNGMEPWCETLIQPVDYLAGAPDQFRLHFARVGRTCSLLILCGAFLCSACSVQELTRDARRPLDYYEIARTSDTMDASAETVTTMFRLLERTEVVTDLQLTQEQYEALRQIYETPSEQIPGLTEFRAEQKEVKQKADLTEKDLERMNHATSRGIQRITAQFRGQRLRALLERRQLTRLEQLTLQTRGPVILVIDTNLASTLNVTPEQLEQMRATLRQTDESLFPALQQFGRGFIAGYGPGETELARLHRMSNSIPKLRNMVLERDGMLLRLLTTEQRDQFRTRQGKPLPIDWDALDFLRQPFDEPVNR